MTIAEDFPSIAAELRRIAPSAMLHEPGPLYDVVMVTAAECPWCFDGGWHMHSLELCGPVFRECEACGNPKGLRAP